MARIEVEVQITVKIVVPSTKGWAADYGLEDDSPEAVEADVRDYFGGGGLADELRNRPGQNTLPWKFADVSDELAAARIVDDPPTPMQQRQASERAALAARQAAERAALK